MQLYQENPIVIHKSSPVYAKSLSIGKNRLDNQLQTDN